MTLETISMPASEKNWFGPSSVRMRASAICMQTAGDSASCAIAHRVERRSNGFMILTGTWGCMPGEDRHHVALRVVDDRPLPFALPHPGDEIACEHADRERLPRAGRPDEEEVEDRKPGREMKPAPGKSGIVTNDEATGRRSRVRKRDKSSSAEVDRTREEEAAEREECQEPAERPAERSPGDRDRRDHTAARPHPQPRYEVVGESAVREDLDRGKRLDPGATGLGRVEEDEGDGEALRECRGAAQNGRLRTAEPGSHAELHDDTGRKHRDEDNEDDAHASPCERRGRPHRAAREPPPFIRHVVGERFLVLLLHATHEVREPFSCREAIDEEVGLVPRREAWT